MHMYIQWWMMLIWKIWFLGGISTCAALRLLFPFLCLACKTFRQSRVTARIIEVYGIHYMSTSLWINRWVLGNASFTNQDLVNSFGAANRPSIRWFPKTPLLVQGFHASGPFRDFGVAFVLQGTPRAQTDPLSTCGSLPWESLER